MNRFLTLMMCALISAVPYAAAQQAMPNEEIIHVLRGLIYTAQSGQEGFKKAAGAVDSPELKTLFESRAQQREGFIKALEQKVRDLGGEPGEAGIEETVAYQGWTNMEAVVKEKNERAILDEAEKGEEAAVNTYQDALKEDLPDDVKDLVKQQANAINDSQEQIKGLKESR